MSAYIVENSVVDFIISAYLVACRGSERIVIEQPDGNCQRFDLSEDSDASELGQILVDANFQSVNYRYSEDDKPHVYKFRKHRAVYGMNDRQKLVIQALKAIHNLDYQSCEFPRYAYSFPKRILSELSDRLAARLPGYDEAEWGAPEHPPEGKGVYSLSDMLKKAQVA